MSGIDNMDEERIKAQFQNLVDLINARMDRIQDQIDQIKCSNTERLAAIMTDQTKLEDRVRAIEDTLSEMRGQNKIWNGGTFLISVFALLKAFFGGIP